jgi:hypothetical protein
MISFTYISKNNEHRDLIMSVKTIKLFNFIFKLLKITPCISDFGIHKDYLGITIFKPINLYHALLFLFFF